MTRMTWEEVCARRLDRHGLAAPRPDTQPADVVRAICGAHAQIMSAAELSIGLRIADCTRADLRDALWNERSLVKTYGPRGTVHLLPTQDLPLWIGALSAIPHSNRLPDDARLTPSQTDEVVAAISKALVGAELTIDELSERVIASTGSWAGDRVMPAFQEMWPRWRQAISTAANRGALCFGPSRGRKVTYTNPHRWLPGFAPADERTALAEIVKRYLYAYGPATPRQFARWFGAPPAWATKLFEDLASELEQVKFEGAAAWVAAGDTAAPPAPAESVRLLPYFDAYAVGCYPRELVFPGAAAARALAGGQAGNFPVLLIDGIVAGVWHQRRAGKKIEITVEPLGELTAVQRRGLDEQAERVGEFLEGSPGLTIGTVKVGPHA
jgi:hypothetical protein